MNSIFDEYAGQVVPIRLHTWWPNGDDCFYLFNSTEIDDRIYYYAGYPPWTSYLYTPSFRFNGKYIADPSDDQFVTYADWYAFVRNTIDSLLAIPTPLRIANFTQTPLLDSVYVSFDVVADDPVYVAGSLRLFMVVTETRHRCPYPVGAHDHVFRDYVPGSTGYPITLLQAGDSLHFDWAWYIDPEYRNDRLVTNLYVEDYPRHGILQAYREVIPEVLSGVDAGGEVLPVSMEPAFPNPFTSATRIAFSLASAGDVRLSVYTPEGRLVSDILDERMGPGAHSATWDGRDRAGNEMGSGVYYYRLVTGGTVVTGKMILLR
jgi:hypothetical protein